MSSKVRELAKQAVTRFDKDMDGSMEPEEFGQWVLADDLQKFAELIIQECMDIALAKKKWVEDQTVFDPRDQAWNKARVQQSQHIVDKIKEHFGVEE